MDQEGFDTNDQTLDDNDFDVDTDEVIDDDDDDIDVDTDEVGLQAGEQSKGKRGNSLSQ